MEILRLVATGATNQQVAQELVISVNTVKVHLRNIYGKLGVASRTEATMVAVQQGWVEIPGADRDDVGQETVSDQSLEEPQITVLPRLDQWPPVSMVKRASLVLAIVLVAAALFAPLILQGRSSNGTQDPISEVFPTAPTGSTTARWHTRAQMPTPRTGLAVTSHNGLIYAIGGVANSGVTGKVEVYDPQADAWSNRNPKPTPVGFVSAAVVGDKIYVPGGIGAGQQIQAILEVYDPVRDRWQESAPLPEPLGAYGLTAFHGQIYLFGGSGTQGYSDAVYRYDPDADSWTAMQSLDMARGFLAAAAVGDRIYVVGGYDDEAEFDSCDAFDPAEGTWSPCASMTQRRGGLAAVSVREQLYALGGGMEGYLVFNERYDPRFDTWSPIGTPVNEEWQGLGATFISPSIYAIGGWSDGSLSVNEAYQALFQSLIPVVP
jgi:DNA-binding CsgD family transcriptional regulator